MRAILPDYLWLGNAGDAAKLVDLADLGIEAVVDLAANEKPVAFPRDWVYCRFPLIDGEGNSPALLRLAVSTVETLVGASFRTLIFCSAGMSRSLAITAAALAKVRHKTLETCLADIAANGPADVAPRLWREIHSACFPTD